MNIPILATKLYLPHVRSEIVLRSRLIEQLNLGLHHKLTLVSAPAGFGKTTLIGEWTATSNRPTAWLSLDVGDSEPLRFITYLIAALKTIEVNVGDKTLGVLKSSQPQLTELILTTLINEIACISDDIVIVLDDYHMIASKQVDAAISFFLEYLPPQMHMVIITREDPDVSLAKLRMRNQLTELRASDLRFTPMEAAEFLNHVMGLKLSTEDIAVLEERTEGWIAGLQLAALSIQGHKDASGFIQSFTGSHQFVLDYILEEVLKHQSESIQTFLLSTSILDRLCAPLCEAILLTSSATGQETLEYLEHANLFLIPLDNERHWYRYHHLFADLLRYQMHQKTATSDGCLAELHIRASQWYENKGMEIEAFHHAAAANDVTRAERLIEGKGMPLHFRGAHLPILHWLESLTSAVLDERPSLWITYASVLLGNGQTSGIEQKLQAAEKVLQNTMSNDKNRDLIGRVASVRAILALSQQQIETIIVQSQLALQYLNPDNLPYRTSIFFNLGYAYQRQGDRVSARKAYSEAILISKASGNTISEIMASIGLGNIQELDNQLYLAEQTYLGILHLVEDHPLIVISEAYIGLAHIYYQWNDMARAEYYFQKSYQLAQQIENTDRSVDCEVFYAHLKLSQGDVANASIILAKADQSARQYNFVHQMPKIAATKVETMLRQGNLTAAAHIAKTYELPMSQVRVFLALGDTSAATKVLEPLLSQTEAKDWKDEHLKVLLLLAITIHAQGEKDMALLLLCDALNLAEEGGFIRIFIDEGLPMLRLLSDAAAYGIMSDYITKLLSVFEAEKKKEIGALVESLSQRELEVLKLIADGLSNDEIGKKLYLALDSVKGHNRRIFGKLQVQRRTEAIARARELGLI